VAYVTAQRVGGRLPPSSGVRTPGGRKDEHIAEGRHPSWDLGANDICLFSREPAPVSGKRGSAHGRAEPAHHQDLEHRAGRTCNEEHEESRPLTVGPEAHWRTRWVARCERRSGATVWLRRGDRIIAGHCAAVKAGGWTSLATKHDAPSWRRRGVSHACRGIVGSPGGSQYLTARARPAIDYGSSSSTGLQEHDGPGKTGDKRSRGPGRG